MALRNIFSLPSLTLMAAAEAVMFIKVFPEHYASHSRLGIIGLILLGNYSLGAIFWLFIYPSFFSPLRNIAGPTPLINNSHRRMFTKEDRPLGEIHREIVGQYPGHDLLNLTLQRSALLVVNPKLLADILVHRPYEFVKPSKIRDFLRYVLGAGLIIVEGDQHKFLRKNTMPAFSFRHIKNLYPMIWSKSGIFTKVIRDEVKRSDPESEKGSGVVEIASWASKVTIDIIGIAGLGRKLNSLEKKKDRLTDLYEELLEPSREKIVFSAFCFALGYPLVKHFPWRMNDSFKYLTSSLEDVCTEMVQDKREAITKKGDDHFDILSLLIKSDNFTDSEMKDQLLTFLAAGHETTASALTWACYLLAKHPDIQERLRKEVQEALPDDPSDNSDFDLGAVLEQLPLCNGIMHETLRLYPTVPQTVREAQKDTYVGEQFIPAGTVMVISIWLINRSRDIWGEDSDEFRPERWITPEGKPNSNGGRLSNYDFLTFLHGPRSCIGQNFAKAEMRCLLAAMVRSFSWSLAMDDREVIPTGVITIRPENGMYLRLTPLT